MQGYCDLFEAVNNFLRDDDRTEIVNVVKILCKLGFVLIILELIFPIEILFLGMIWLTLIVCAPFRENIMSVFLPKFHQVNNFINKVTDRVGESRIAKIISLHDISTYTIIKELHIYEYQRWWVGKEWVSSHWSDEDRQLVLLARKEAPKHWKWVENWKIVSENNADEEGFEYTNDLLGKYTPSKSLKTIRRRKWTRRCLQKFDRFSKEKKKRSLDSSTSKIE